MLRVQVSNSLFTLLPVLQAFVWVALVTCNGISKLLPMLIFCGFCVRVRYCVSVLPPVLVPRYSEYPNTLAPFQQVPEPAMPNNVSFPHHFPNSQQGQQSPSSSSSVGPGSPFAVSGMYFAVHNPSLMHVAMKVAAFRLNFRDCSCVFAAETPPPPYQVVHPSSPGQGNTSSCQESKPMDTSGPAAPMHHHSSKSHPFRMY